MDREVKQEDSFGTKEEAIATVVQLSHRALGNGGLSPALGFRLEHLIKPDGGQVQDPDATPEADRNKMESVPRRNRLEACGLT